MRNDPSLKAHCLSWNCLQIRAKPLQWQFLFIRGIKLTILIHIRAITTKYRKRSDRAPYRGFDMALLFRFPDMGYRGFGAFG